MRVGRRELIGALAATAAAGTVFPVAAREEPTRLVIADGVGDRGLLAPYTHHRNGPGYLYTSYVFDTLLDQDIDGNPVPALARSWRRSADGLTWDLDLDERARWHDGRPVTAADAAFTFAYMAEHPYVFGSVAGVRAVEVVANDRLRVILQAPDAGFPSNALLALPILPRHVYADQPAPERFAEPRAATGSGPYRLAGYDKAQGRTLLERNPAYHRGTPRFERIAIVRMAPDAAIQAMRDGAADVIPDLPFERVEQARAAGLDVLTAPSNHPVRLVFNHRGRFAAKATRHALAHALDRPALVDIVHRGSAVVAETGFFQAGSSWRSRQADPRYDHDPEKAGTLLRGQGWSRDGTGRWRPKDSQGDGVPVTLQLVTDRRLSRLATALADQLEGFGIAVEARVLEPAAVQESLRADRYDLALASLSTLGDPGGIANRVLGLSWNSDRFPDTGGAMKALLDAQGRTTDVEERRSHLRRFQSLYAEELPSLMLANPLWATAHNGRIAPRYLPNGIAIGIPLALPKAILLR